ncbi:hypothetical protein GCE9029_03242 [Grimontia celer]|uniref:ATPase AAA-type core domain-containing protein n=2 Tax=Grimontia celer TaxID=1796497 RepID=A0A128F822_9GAMM|nr:hypothetical protein GCE9029_03242 [Grimontia celer]
MKDVTLTSIRFLNYKALKNFSLSFNAMNILVGPNNAGKSTVISALRILESALKIANSKSAVNVPYYSGGYSLGHRIPEDNLPVSLENVHTDYSDVNTTITFRFSNRNKLVLFFPCDGGCVLNIDTDGKSARTPSAFKKAFPFKVQVVPVLGPIEQEEKIVTDATVKKSVGTPRASRHFRNYWYKNPEGFDDFKYMLEETWPGMSIQPPELTTALEQRLVMFCSESRQDREVYWAGFGFQIWCQLLTHISRSNEYSLTVIDEPEVYLHPDVQRQLLGILREIDVDVLLATHSTEILGEADPSEILLVDKRLQAARRLRDVEGVQQALDSIGSIQNITLTQLARTKKVLFVEGMGDYKVIRRFARKMGFIELASGSDITPFESGGYSSWERVRSLAWGIKNTLGADIKIAAVYDHDYWCEEEVEETLNDLNSNLSFAHIHQRKEIENYLLVPSVLQRLLVKLVKERNSRKGFDLQVDEEVICILDELSTKYKNDLQGQYIGRYTQFHQKKGSPEDISTLTSNAIDIFDKKWSDISLRMEIVCGKKVLKDLRSYISDKWSVTLTDIKIIDEFNGIEIPNDMRSLVDTLDRYRNQ